LDKNILKILDKDKKLLKEVELKSQREIDFVHNYFGVK
jgi:hypothetical protein